MIFWKTKRLKSDGGETHTHLDGPIGDSYTLCGVDTAGDPMVHAKPPEKLTGKRRITCPHCLAIIDAVRDYLEETDKNV